jgi:hypothetical protein
MIRIIACLLCTCVLALFCIPAGAQKRPRKNIEGTAALEFTAGNIVVCRVGTGTGSLSTAAAAVFLDEYTSDGTFVSSTAMPTTNGVVQKALTVAGTAATITECHLNRSTDGNYLVLAGYAQTPGTSTVSSSMGPRVFARVDSAGNIDTSTTTTSFGTSVVRGAAATDGSGFWATGSSAGVVYMPFGTTGSGTIVSNTITSLRGINIFGGQLYTSSNVGSYRLGTVGTGAPTTTSNTSTNLLGFPTGGSPQAFFFADLEPSVAGMDTLYVADDGSAGATSTSGGLKKFSLVSGNWTFNGIFPASASPAIGASSFFGVTGEVSGTQVTLFATRTTGQLVRFVDSTGYNAAPTAVPTLLVTAAANTAFRGVALAPLQPAVVPNLSINDVSQSEGNAGTTAYTFTVTLSSPAPAGGVTFDIATADGTAQDNDPVGEDADYVSNSLIGQTIAAGATTYQFTVQVNGDENHEPNESYFVNVTNVTGATVADGQGEGTIVNDDLAPTAGAVSIAGRIMTRDGRGVSGATVSVMDQNAVTFSVRTDSQGFYRFESVPGGQSYVLMVKSETFSFSPQVLTAYADVSGLNIYPVR